MLPFQWHFYVDGLGTYFVGLAAVVSVLLIQWQTNFKSGWVNQIFRARYLLAIVVAFALGMLALIPTYLTALTFKNYENYFFYQGYCGLHVVAIFIGWVGAACLISEFWGLPSWSKRK